ncbi:hypothetical protein K8S19_10815 [bacterium]|nr:hypothetical protein [bacterium]
MLGIVRFSQNTKNIDFGAQMPAFGGFGAAKKKAVAGITTNTRCFSIKKFVTVIISADRDRAGI